MQGSDGIRTEFVIIEWTGGVEAPSTVSLKRRSSKSAASSALLQDVIADTSSSARNSTASERSNIEEQATQPQSSLQSKSEIEYNDGINSP